MAEFDPCIRLIPSRLLTEPTLVSVEGAKVTVMNFHLKTVDINLSGRHATN